MALSCTPQAVSAEEAVAAQTWRHARTLPNMEAGSLTVTDSEADEAPCRVWVAKSDVG